MTTEPAAVSASRGHLSRLWPFRMEKRVWRGGFGRPGWQSPKVAGPGPACAPWRPVPCAPGHRQCHPDVTDQSGGRRGSSSDSLVGIAHLNKKATRWLPWGTVTVLNSVVCLLIPSSHLRTPKRIAVWRRSHGRISSLPAMRGKNSSFPSPGGPWASS